MNDLSTVKPLYPGAFPSPETEDDDAPYPKAPLNRNRPVCPLCRSLRESDNVHFR